MRQAFAGMLWGKQLYYYDVAALARRRPDAAAPPASRARRAQRPLAQLRGVRHHVDARPVGVPVVRGVGHGVPLRRARARRSGVREVPADAALPRVVPASERRAAGVRVGVRRRQPAGAGVGGAPGVRHRRRPRHRLPEPRLRQAARQLHVVGEPPGRGRLERLRGRLPRSRQHRADRPLAPARRATCSSRRTRPGWMACYALTMAAIAAVLNRHGRPATDLVAEVPRALLAHLGGDGREGALGRGGRLLLRPAASPGRLRRAGQGALDGRRAAADGVRGRRRERGGPRARRSASTSPGCSTAHDQLATDAGRGACAASRRRTLVGVVGVEHLLRVLRRLFDESAFLSPYGLRAVSRWHREHPYHLDMGGYETSIDYEPAESTTVDVRRQLELARARSGSRSTTSSSTRSCATRGTSATSSRSSTRPAPASSRTLSEIGEDLRAG